LRKERGRGSAEVYERRGIKRVEEDDPSIGSIVGRERGRREEVTEKNMSSLIKGKKRRKIGPRAAANDQEFSVLIARGSG